MTAPVIDAQVKQADITALNRAITRLRKDTGVSAQGSVLFAANKVAASAAGASKRGKKNRAIRPNPNRTGRGRKAQGALLQIVVLRQGTKPTRFLPTNNRRDPRRVIARRGLAKEVWQSIGFRLSLRRGGGVRRRSARWAKVVKRLTQGDPSVTLTSGLSYQRAAFPTLEATAIIKGTRAIKQHSERWLARAQRSDRRIAQIAR